MFLFTLRFSLQVSVLTSSLLENLGSAPQFSFITRFEVHVLPAPTCDSYTRCYMRRQWLVRICALKYRSRKILLVQRQILHLLQSVPCMTSTRTASKHKFNGTPRGSCP